MTRIFLHKSDAAKELLIRRRARSSILDYANAIDIPGKPVGDEESDFFLPVETTIAKHHRLILETFDEISETPHGRAMLFLPPGSAKSTMASIVGPSRYLGSKPNRRVILATYGDDLARKMGRKTRSIVKQPRYKQIFKTELSSDSAAVQEFSLTNGSEYMACGILSGVTGNRAGLLVIDDPVKGREQAESETIREKTWDAYQDDLLTRLIPGGSVIIIQTRWHQSDLAGKILPEDWNGESGDILCRDGNIWKILCIQAKCEVANDPLGREYGEYLWPEWFDRKHWAQFENSARTWGALYQQRPRPSGGDEFKREWVQYYGTSVNHYDMGRVMLVDPSGSKKKKKSDYTCIWVIGLGGDGNYYVLDIVRDKLNLTERTEAVFRLHRKWKVQQVRYEQYGLQSDIEHIQGEMNVRSYRFRIIEVGGSLQKEDRIRKLVPIFQTGRMWFMVSLSYTGYDGLLCDLINVFVEKEMLPFPVGANDDMLDSLARIAEDGIDLPWPKEDDFNMGLGGGVAEGWKVSVGSMGY